MTSPPTAAESARRPPAWLERLAVTVTDGVAWVQGGSIAWANDRLVELAGRGTGLVGAALEDLLLDLGEGLPAEAAGAVPCRIRRPDGTSCAVRCRCAWRGADDGSSAYVIQDVARQDRLEQELLRAGRELAGLHRELEAQRDWLRGERAEREEMLTIVSHELRTPVTVIGGYNRLLLSEEAGPLTPEQRKFLEESGKSCQRLDAFIENWIEASRAGRGPEVLEVGRGPIAPVIHEVVAMFRPLLEERDLRLSCELAPTAAEARFDRVRLEQVLTNLIGNAVKFTPRGGTIEIATRPVATPDHDWVRSWVEISVTDDGLGIAAGDRERIFEPYVQLGEGGDGLGLGLAICRRLVEAHGGSIRLEERVGRGCRFSFTLPAEAPRRPGAPPAARGRS